MLIFLPLQQEIKVYGCTVSRNIIITISLKLSKYMLPFDDTVSIKSIQTS